MSRSYLLAKAQQDSEQKYYVPHQPTMAGQHNFGILPHHSSATVLTGLGNLQYEKRSPVSWRADSRGNTPASLTPPSSPENYEESSSTRKCFY